jgi:hypothetical protein
VNAGGIVQAGIADQSMGLVRLYRSSPSDRDSDQPQSAKPLGFTAPQSVLARADVRYSVMPRSALDVD